MHRFIPESGDDTALGHAAAIKRWTREILRLPENAVVAISEIACADAGCPLVETAVTVFDEAGARPWKFTRPRAAVTKLMLWQTPATPPLPSQKSKPTKNLSNE